MSFKRLIPKDNVTQEFLRGTTSLAFFKSGAQLRTASYSTLETKADVYDFITDGGETGGSIRLLSEVPNGDLLVHYKDGSNIDTLWLDTVGDGVAFTKVLTFGTAQAAGNADRGPLGHQGIAYDGVNVYIAEYRTDVTNPDATIWKSTDSGATWAVFWEYNILLANFKHCHSVVFDDVNDMLVFSMGDSSGANARPAIISAADTFSWSSVDDDTAETINSTSNIEILFDQQRYRGISPVLADDGFFYDYVDSGDFSSAQSGIFRYKSTDLAGTFEKAYDPPERAVDNSVGARSILLADGSILFTNFNNKDEPDWTIYFHVRDTSGNFATIARFSIWTGSAISGDEWLGSLQQVPNGDIYLAGNGQVNGAGHARTRIVTYTGIPNNTIEEIGSTFFVDPISGSDVNDGSTQARAFKTAEHAMGLGLPFGSRVITLSSISETDLVVSIANSVRPTIEHDREFIISAGTGGQTFTITNPYNPSPKGLDIIDFSGVSVMPFFGTFSSDPVADGMVTTGSLTSDNSRSANESLITPIFTENKRLTSVGGFIRNTSSSVSKNADIALYECTSAGLPTNRVMLWPDGLVSSMPTVGIEEIRVSGLSIILEAGKRYTVAFEGSASNLGVNLAFGNFGAQGAGQESYNDFGQGAGNNLRDPWVRITKVDQEYAVFGFYEDPTGIALTQDLTSDLTFDLTSDLTG